MLTLFCIKPSLSASNLLRALAAMALLAGAGAMASGCSPDANRGPALLGLQDVTFEVNVPSRIDVLATDPDGDDLQFTFELDPPPATMSESAGGRPTINKLDRSRAVFLWTPGIADAGPNDQTAYALTLEVRDRGGRTARETVQILVVNAGFGPASLVFVEPPGAGMAVDIGQTPCIDGLPVRVQADLIPDDEVELRLADPAPAGANLFPPDPGKSKQFSWCPSPEDLDRSLSHTVAFEARRLNDDQPVVKRFLLRFKRNAGANCPGAPPVIDHAPPGAFSGPLNYEIQATITDDVGFKSPPILAFTTETPSGGAAVDTSGWQLVEMSADGPGLYRASIPNLNLADGQSVEVSYVIIATDNDDPDGTRCDHSTESPVHRFTATGGGAAGGETYGDCAPCVADAQCGGEADLCVPLLGEFFCAHACTGGCGPELACVELTSIDGVTSFQCIPQNANCGQVCTDDAYDAGGIRNDAVEAATPLAAGRLDGLSICDQDVDVFRFPVEAGASVTATVVFENARGDLDLFMQLPGDPADEYPYQSANADLDTESVSEPCIPQSGDAVIVVAPFQDARNAYAIEVTSGPGDCDQMCIDDVYDEQAPGNDVLDDFTLLDSFPAEVLGMVICRQDADYYGFDVRAGEVVRAGVTFTHRAGDLDLRLFRSSGEAVAESLSYRDVELVELTAPTDDIYVLAVFGATRSVSNVYDLVVEKYDTNDCQVTIQCPGGQYCNDGQCVAEACNGPRACGATAQCVAAQACLDPAGAGGTCADDCRSSFECRGELGYACKRFEDSTAGCLREGPARTGDRCVAHTDCEGTDICLPLPGGYCATGGCFGDDCPPGTMCTTVPGDCSVPACLKACEGPADCRAGLSCRPVQGGSVCLP